MPESMKQLLAANTALVQQVGLLHSTIAEQREARQALEESEKRYRRLFESAKDGVLILDAETGRVVDVNPFLLELLGYSYNALYGRYLWELGVFRDIAASKEAFRILQDHEYIRYEDLPLKTLDGRSIAVEFVSNVYMVDHNKVIQCNIRDITARKRVEAEHKRLMAAIEQTGESIVMTDEAGVIQFVNPAFERTSGYRRSEVVGRNTRMLKSGVQDDRVYRDLWDVISSGRVWAGRLVNRREDGTLYTVDTTISPVRDPTGKIVNYVAVKRDITEQLRLAAQLQQAQKMEAVGLLAGGVAHDFNNMLTVILGYAELALSRMGPAEPLHGDLEEIRKAAKHSAGITRQLLAFARKQPIVPVVLDLNRSVENTLRMVRRLIGEHIDLVWHPGAGVAPVRMDPVQLSQVLANLCVNSRDAIEDVGTVAIATEMVIVDEAYRAGRAWLVPGEYVMLSVGDDGCGMDKGTLDRVFEPFFTSKGEQGTGLGLATVYGIVKQNEGFIDVSSEPAKGTTFRIYLPQCAGEAIAATGAATAAIAPGGGGTVLIVEDEAALLTLNEIILKRLGYRVLVAGTPELAIGLAEKHAGEIRLLLTDVVMPGMNGLDLAARLLGICPNMRVLFMSGHTADLISPRGVLDGSMNFIQKPFGLLDLGAKVSGVLAAR